MLTCLQEGDDNDFGGCKILRAVPLRYKVDDNTRDEDPEFFSTDPDPAQLKKFRTRIRIRLRIRPEIEMKKKIFLYFR